MKNVTSSIAAIALAAIFTISGTSPASADVSAQQNDTATSPKAFVRVKGEIKTHSPRHHVFEKTIRGTKSYTLELVAGGKKHVLTAVPEKDVVPRGDRKNPEEGKGLRYTFTTEFAVPAGKHDLVLRLPGEGVTTIEEVTFAPGENTLVITPVYRKIARDRIILNFRGERHFSQHVESLRAVVKGKEKGASTTM